MQHQRLISDILRQDRQAVKRQRFFHLIANILTGIVALIGMIMITIGMMAM